MSGDRRAVFFLVFTWVVRMFCYFPRSFRSDRKAYKPYVDGNIGVGMNSMSLARGTLVHSASPQGTG